MHDKHNRSELRIQKNNSSHYKEQSFRFLFLMIDYEPCKRMRPSTSLRLTMSSFYIVHNLSCEIET